MDFAWSDEQLALRRSVAEFAAAELNDDVVARDKAGTFPWDAWRKCVDFGLLGYAAPEAYGGGPERDLLSSMLAMEGLGYGCRDNGLAFGVSVQLWTIQHSILRFGTDDQKRRFLPGLVAGTDLGAHALTEPGSGSDVFSLTSRAERVEGGYRLTGHKRLVTFAPIADLAIAFATVDPALGRWGITGFLVPLDQPGVTRRPTDEKMGLRTIPFGEIVFEDVFVPEADRLGPEGAGVSLTNETLKVERCCILAVQLGAMERQLEDTVAFAKEREQYGKPIGHFQSVSNRIADMKVRLETARLLLYKTAWLIQTGEPAQLESSMVKLHLTEAWAASSLDALRIRGGSGYLTEMEVERDLRDSLGGTLYAGTSDIQRNLVARLLGL